jgi:hypothetical protein
MSHSTTTGDNEQAEPLYKLLGFKKRDFVSVAWNKVQTARTIPASAIEEFRAAAPGGDYWIGAQSVKPETTGRASAADVAALRVLYLDLDLKDNSAPDLHSFIDHLSELLGEAPVSIVYSGGGMHPRWKLTDGPTKPKRIQAVLDGWKTFVKREARVLGVNVDSVFDAPRVLRLPGTVNTKYGPPRPVRIDASTGHALDVDSLPFSTKSTKPAKASSARTVKMVANEHIDDVAGALSDVVDMQMDRLALMKRQGWKGEPWHNTTVEVTTVLAKVLNTSGCQMSVDDVYSLYMANVPYDDDQQNHVEVIALWDSAMKKNEGVPYELNYDPDEDNNDIFADALASGAVQPVAPKDLAEVIELRPPVLEVINGESKPLMPGFRDKDLRGMDYGDVDPATFRRMKVLAENFVDDHRSNQHEYYIHPFCIDCRTPEDALRSLYRWMIDHSAPKPPDIWDGKPPGDGELKNGFEMMKYEPGKMLIDEFLPDKKVGFIIGQGGTYKTFMALSMALAIAGGQEEWLGERGVQESGNVFYLAGEGIDEFPNRFGAWFAANGYDEPPSWFENFYGTGRMPNFYSGGEDYDRLVADAERLKPKLIVIDTLQRAVVGADQNSAVDMGMVGRNLQLLREASGGTVLVIAHTGKDDGTIRGSSALEFDSDFSLHVKKTDELQLVVEVSRMKDGPSGQSVPFYMQEVENSLVIVVERTDGRILTASTENDKRVLTALDSIDVKRTYLGQTDIIKATDFFDGRGEMARSTTARTLKRLVDSGDVEITQSTGGAVKYRIGAEAKARLSVSAEAMMRSRTG